MYASEPVVCRFVGRALSFEPRRSSRITGQHRFNVHRSFIFFNQDVCLLLALQQPLHHIFHWSSLYLVLPLLLSPQTLYKPKRPSVSSSTQYTKTPKCPDYLTLRTSKISHNQSMINYFTVEKLCVLHQIRSKSFPLGTTLKKY